MLLQEFQALLTEYTGLAIAEADQEKVRQLLETRSGLLKLNNADYLSLLRQDVFASSPEWQALVQALTVPESYFWRDKGQMRVLEQHILPELIASNQQRRRLRLWSAGCSTGEEPYSLAMLLSQLLPDLAAWDVQILATDINANVLAKAKTAQYAIWSFRDCGAEVLRHFKPLANGMLALEASIRDRVHFRRANLRNSAALELLEGDMDLILCRNVFIYFDAAAIAGALKTMHLALRPGGYLLTGHGELYQQQLDGFHALPFPETVVYQKRTGLPAERKSAIQPPVPASLPMPTIDTDVAPLAQFVSGADFSACYRRGEYAHLLALAKQHLDQAVDYHAHYWSAKALANMGEYVSAEAHLQMALTLETHSSACRYLLAHIKAAQNDIDQAEQLLQEVIALDQGFVPAYLDLAELYLLDQPLKYQALRSKAVDLLVALPPEHYFEELETSTHELLKQLR